jgi:Tol biopolymer transport system component
MRRAAGSLRRYGPDSRRLQGGGVVWGRAGYVPRVSRGFPVRRGFAFAVSVYLAGAVAFTVGANAGDGDALADSRVTALPETKRPQLAFVRGTDLALANDRGRGLRLLSGESLPGTVIPAMFSDISWAPDGSRIAFAAMEHPDEEEYGEPERTPPTDIYVIAPDGSAAQRVTAVGDALDPVWSPDGGSIVFTRFQFTEGSPLRGELWSVAFDGSPPIQLTAAEPWQSDYAGSFSPDGSKLAFTRTTLNPRTLRSKTVIHVAGPDGAGAEVLLKRAADPAFSPNGKRIAFVSDRARNGKLCYGDRCFFGAELYLARANGSDPRRLTRTTELNEESPSWMPDGSRIAYQRGKVVDNAEATSILQMNTAGGCARKVHDGRPSWAASPAWRPSEPRRGGGPLRC